jgi:hypothetical protein
MESAAKRLESIAQWAWTAVLVVLFHALWPLEWSFPYCNDQSDGPAYAAYGFPLPYRQYDGASSGSSVVQPLALAFDLLLLGAMTFWLVRWGLARLPGRRLRLAVAWTGLAASLTLGSLAVLVESLETTVAWSIPMAGSYLEYRPVSWHGRGWHCTPSPRWFGPVRESVRRTWNASNPDLPL